MVRIVITGLLNLCNCSYSFCLLVNIFIILLGGLHYAYLERTDLTTTNCETWFSVHAVNKRPEPHVSAIQ